MATTEDVLESRNEEGGIGTCTTKSRVSLRIWRSIKDKSNAIRKNVVVFIK